VSRPVRSQLTRGNFGHSPGIESSRAGGERSGRSIGETSTDYLPFLGTVLVHLLAAALFRAISPSSFPPRPSSSSSSSSSAIPSTSSSSEPTLPRIPTVYIRCPSPFPQVEAFVSLCVNWYNLDLEAVEGGMKEGLQTYLDHQLHRRDGGEDGREVKAVLVGTRRGDPHGGAFFFSFFAFSRAQSPS
jgi:hypothetical protein